MKKNLPTDIIAAGKLEASVTLRRKPSHERDRDPVWQGGGEVLALNVRSSAHQHQARSGQNSFQRFFEPETPI